ncbi:PspA/IM30 family protein [Lishizhenia sp.]|uniref:PspA/IM30 family protein n=1 Tax=Lishizhenia sp. TaxID=2497594 RepID=UPI00299D202A|nr:PspA/IM30 family protein [Lishizhenia sp.]MDX1446278.1 PspA/IM30 family protein [Lishizhenia sp.]
MNIFKRLFNIGKAEAHSAIDGLEDPIKMTEQGIRDLKKDLEKALQALAEVKALSIRAKNDAETQVQKAEDYEKKAMLILQKAKAGSMDAAEADRLASEALIRKEETMKLANQSKSDREKFEAHVAKLDGNVKNLRSSIGKYENELKTLKARAKVSSATKNINKQLANIDSSSTVSMLERMKEKVAQEEALAESYADIADESRSIDEELDKAIDEGANESKASESLEALKKKMGM